MAKAAVYLPYAQDPFGHFGVHVQVWHNAVDTSGDIVQKAHEQMRLAPFVSDTLGASTSVWP